MDWQEQDHTHAWLIGGGIASLAAAVFLITDAELPASRIHVFEVHSRPGGAITSFGDADTGYVVREGRELSTSDVCTERFLSLVPSTADADKTLWDQIKDDLYRDEYRGREKSSACILIEGATGPEMLDLRTLGLGVRDRLEVIRVMLDAEDTFEGKRISDVFQVRFMFKPRHSVLEFRRYLRRFLHGMLVGPEGRTPPPAAGHARYDQYESTVQPVIEFLEKEGVDFRLNEEVTDLTLDSESEDLLRISGIKYVSAEGLDLHVVVHPRDLTFVTLGSIGAGTVLGTNTSAPEVSSTPAQDAASWRLWHKLAQKSPAVFKNPTNFTSHAEDSTLETFTVTTEDLEFLGHVRQLLQNASETQQQHVSILNSPWLMGLRIPPQPFCHGQPANVHIFWGWAMHPEKEGHYIKKSMTSCSGEEIMMELLQHLHFPLVPTLNCSITVPCVIPLCMSPLLRRRVCGDRPAVIPEGTTNMALLGQFIEIADEAALTMEYSVRGAQMAVDRLMGLPDDRLPRRRDRFVEMLDLLA